MTISLWAKFDEYKFFSRLYDLGNGGEGTDSLTVFNL